VKTISLRVSDAAYDELKSIAARQNRPVAAVLREAMEAYLEAERRRGTSVIDLPSFHCGPLREPWTRSQLLDENQSRGK
jgi:hypothetical protein